MTTRTTSLILLAAVALSTGCGEKKPKGGQTDDGQPVIAATNYPLAYFAERLAGKFATIIFDAPSDEDPAFWKPTDEQVATMQGANLILMNGATYEKWAATTTLPFSAVVDTSASFSSNLIEVKEAITHAHSKDDAEHSHGGTAFTTWLDLTQASFQAAAIADAIMEEWPDHKATVQKNLAGLIEDLQALDSAMKSATAKLKDAPVLASHPIYQYWERAYGLKVPSLPWEPEMELDAEAMADLKTLHDANPGAKYFVWEGEPLPGHIEKLKAVGLTNLVVAPCMNRPESGDFLSVMKANIAAIENATK